MFFHIKELQYHAKPDKPDPLFAKKPQEILGGQFGEISVALQYLFQGWSVRGNGKYKDLLMDTGAEELAHIEMLATMIARLLDGAPVGDLEKAAKDPVIGAILGGMNPQRCHRIRIRGDAGRQCGKPLDRRLYYRKRKFACRLSGKFKRGITGAPAGRPPL